MNVLLYQLGYVAEPFRKPNMCAEKKSELDTPSCGARRGRPFAALSPFRCQLQSACRCVTVAVQKSNQVDFLRVPPAARPACDPLTSPSQRAPRSGACARRWPRSCLSSLQSRAPPPKLRPRLLPRARLKEHLKLHQLVPRLMGTASEVAVACVSRKGRRAMPTSAAASVGSLVRMAEALRSP